jgi:hypothetical protein
MTADVLQTLTSLILGLFVGSLLTEGGILVPYWRSLKPESFLSLYGTLGPHLERYFAPLTVAATLIPTITFVFCYWVGAEGWIYSASVAVIMLAILGIFYYYFKSANASFASGSVGMECLPAELRRWSNWHWLRTVMGLVAFVLSLVAIVV